MRAFRALLSFSAVFASLAAWSSEANAYERQWQAALGLGYAQLYNGGGTTAAAGVLPGFGANLGLSYGINDSFNAIAHADFSLQPGATPVFVAGGGAGIAYVLDILQWVPWIGVTVDGYGVTALNPCVSTNDLSCSNGRLGFSGLFGLDYQVSRRFSLGGGLRYGLLLLGNQNNVDQTLSVSLRAQYIWGY